MLNFNNQQSNFNIRSKTSKSTSLVVAAVILTLLVVCMVSSAIFSVTAKSTEKDTKQSSFEAEYNIKSKVNPNNSENAYVTLVSSEGYLAGALAMYKSIIARGGKYDLVLVVTGKKISDIVRNIETYRSDPLIKRVHIFIASYIDNPNAKIPEPRFIDTYNKLHIWKLDQYGYKRLVFVDSDCIIFKNVDLLFNCAGPVCSGSDMGNTEFFNGGIMVIEPNTKTYEDMMDKMGTPAYKSYDGGEQGFINLYFDFHHKSKGWELERELDEATSEEEKQNIITKYKETRNVWRIPYTWNTEVPMYYFFKYAYIQRLKRQFRIIHYNLPIKPWKFLQIPVLDASYYWYEYALQLPQFSVLPASLVGLFIAEVFVLVFGITCSNTLFPMLLSKLLPENSCLTNAIHFKLKRAWSTMKNKKTQKRPISLYEGLKKTIILRVWPIASFAIITLASSLFFIKFVSNDFYDPHTQWISLFSTVIMFNCVALSFYRQFVKEQTRQCIISNFDQTQLIDNTELNKKIISFFPVYQALAILVPPIGFLSICLFIYLTRLLFLVNVLILALFVLAVLGLEYFVLKNLGKQTIYTTFKKMLKIEVGKV